MSESESDLTRHLLREMRARQRAESLLEDSNRKLASARDSLRRLVGRVKARVEDQTEHQAVLNAARRESLAKTRFVTTVNHELRTRLNSLLSAAALLRDTALDGEQAELITLIEREGADLRSRIDQILDLTNIQSGQTLLESNEIFIPDLVEDVLTLFAADAARKGLSLWGTISRPAARWIVGDSGRLRQILINLVDNAVKYTRRGHVSIDVSRSQADALTGMVFAVIDSGPGVASGIVEALAGAGVGNKRPAAHDGDLGLGLSIAAQSADLLGGTLRARPQKAGSRFEFCLPLSVCLPRRDRALTALRRQARTVQVSFANQAAKNDWRLRQLARDWRLNAGSDEGGRSELECAVFLDPEPAEVKRGLTDTGATTIVAICESRERELELQGLDHPSVFVFRPPLTNYGLLKQLLMPEREKRQAGSVAAGAAKQGASLRVLVVDDSLANQMVTSSLVTRLGHRVTAVSSGKEAIQTTARIAFDVVLMDLRMPGMDGFEAARRIRQSQAAHAPPAIIAVTANTLETDRETCTDAGMVDYLPKPVDLSRLQAAILRWGSRAKAIRGQRQMDALQSVPLLDRKDLRRLEKEVDRSLIPEIAEAFIKEAESRLAQIEQALASGAVSEIVGNAQPLQSASASFGARRFGQWALFLERAAREGRAQEIAAVLADVKECCRDTRESLAKVVAEIGAR